MSAVVPEARVTEGNLVQTVDARASFVSGIWRFLSQALWLVFRVLTFPFRIMLSIRRSMTSASVTLLLVGIITLNIVWGYPWTGAFSACVSMFLVGWAINRFTRPQLRVNYTLPPSAPAEQLFSVVTHVQNRGHLPAMELGLLFHPVERRRRRDRQEPLLEDTQKTPHAISMIRPGERTDLRTALTFFQRGIHHLPDLQVTSMFPFHLFQNRFSLSNAATIAITPKILSGDEDLITRGQINALGSFSRKLLSGDALDYTGSREYEVGMPVRRWDFASWARLGKPIVREYQSPSIQMVTLIVDSSSDTEGRLEERHPLIERVFSLAATAVNDLSRKAIHVRMYVTGETTNGMAREGGFGAADCQTLLIRLAGAQRTSSQNADQCIQEVVDQIGNTPALVLTSRKEFTQPKGLSRNTTVIHVEDKS